MFENVNLGAKTPAEQAARYRKQMAENLRAMIAEGEILEEDYLMTVLGVLEGKPAEHIYVIYEGNHPSVNHAGYKNEEECKKEIERLNGLKDAHNERVRNNPATGRGSAFLNMERKTEWSYKKVSLRGTSKCHTK
jgi:hypothetical protein